MRCARSLWVRANSSLTRITSDSVLEIDTVLTCVRVLAESIASFGLDVYETTDKGGSRLKSHRLHELVRWQPNPEWTSYELRLWLMIDCLLRGNGYAQVIRDGKGNVESIWPLMAARMNVTRKNGKLWYMYQMTGGDEKASVAFLPASDVLHIKAFSCGGLVSPSLIDLGNELFGIARASDVYAGTFFANGTQVSGMLQVPEELGQEAFDRLKKQWEDTYSGKHNAHKTPLLEGGTKFDPIVLNHKESQLLESRQYTRSQIAGVFRVPAHLVNDLAKATFSNIEQEDLAFVKHTLRPWLVNIEQRLRMTLLTDDERAKELFFKHNVNDLLRGDLKSRVESYSLGAQSGVWSPNDILRKEDEETYEGGDAHFVNANLIPVGTQPKKSNEDS